MHVLFATLMVLGLSGSQFGNETPKEKDNGPLEGEWVVVSLSYSGYELRPPASRPMTVTFAKDGKATWPSFSGNVTVNLFNWNQRTVSLSVFEQSKDATYRIDSSKSPPQIDLDVQEAGEKIKRRSGIYERKGEQLRICLGGLSRPASFQDDSTNAVFAWGVVTLLDQESLGEAVVDRLEGKKVKDDVLIVRALYRIKDGKQMELMFRLKNGKVTSRGDNKFGDDWRNHLDEVLKEFK
jgi:uncharacterized protein (TIGR03067 family)